MQVQIAAKKVRPSTSELITGPGPATLLAKGYASLFQKTLRKGLFLSFLYVLAFGKKGLSLKECQQFRKKGYFLRHFHWKRVILRIDYGDDRMIGSRFTKTVISQPWIVIS